MDYRPFREHKVSLLGLGCMRLPKRRHDAEDIDVAKAQSIVDRAIDAGVNYFDTAWMYHGGESESFTGEALRRYPRERYFIADKMPIWEARSEGDLERIFNEQLRRCGIEYFDFYLVHSLNQENYQRMVSLEARAFLEQKRQAGQIRYIGFSYHDSPMLLQTICEQDAWDFAQIQLNYLDWVDQDAKRQYELLERYGIPTIIMEPVRGGALADLGDAANALLRAANPEGSIASWAMRYAASLPNVMTVLSGMSTLEQLEDNLRTLSPLIPLTRDEEAALQAAVTQYRKRDQLPCTGCRYCIDCPSALDIPGIFAIYNTYLLENHPAAFRERLEELLKESAAPGDCIECGACVAHCPGNCDSGRSQKDPRTIVRGLPERGKPDGGSSYRIYRLDTGRLLDKPCVFWYNERRVRIWSRPGAPQHSSRKGEMTVVTIY